LRSPAPRHYREHVQGKPLPLKLLAHILRDVAEGCEALHRHEVLHMDLKPSNILLQSRQPSSGAATSVALEAVVADFGIAVREDGDRGYVTGTSALGSLGPMAPEVFARTGPTGE
jgi:eukaryotic-like serine/threonine-protein kinase